MEVPNIRISTMTQISHISSQIDLSKLYEYLMPNESILYIEYADEIPKGKRVKPKKINKRGPGDKPTKRKQYFYNQVTIHLQHTKIINLKLFNNGGIQMTGLKGFKQGDQSIRILLKEIKKLSEDKRSEIFINNQDPQIIEEKKKMVMINSNFSVGFPIHRENLHRQMLSLGYYSSYDSSIYPAVNLKYYYNPSKQTNGVCNCKGLCDGKGKEGCCRKITIAIFNSGQIIITGAQEKTHLYVAYHFINNYINDNKASLCERNVAI